MSLKSLFSSSDPVSRNRFIALSVVTVLTVCANLIGMFSGITVVFSHLLYFPLILAGYWFPKRGILFSVAIAAVYGTIAILFSLSDPLATITILSRCAILVVIGSIVSILSSKLRESEQQLHDIIEVLPDATFAINLNGTVIAWNRAIEKMTGISKSDMINRGNYEYALPFYLERRPVLADLIIHPDPEKEARYPELKKEGTRLVAEVFIPHLHGGQGAHLRIAATPLSDTDGRLTGAIESIRDVTEQLMLETALQNAGSRLNILAGIVRSGISKKLSVLYGHLSIGAMKFNNPEVISFISDVKDSADGIQRQIEISSVFRDLGTAPPAWIKVQDAVVVAADRNDFGYVVYRVWTERLEVFADTHISTVFFHLFEMMKRDIPDMTKVIVTYHIRPDVCAILIEGDGKGIPLAEKDSLFTPRNEMYGCGLYLALEILTITAMTIHETGNPGKGTRFEILIPPEGYRVSGTGEANSVLLGVVPDSAGSGDTPGKNGIKREPLPTARELRSDEFSRVNEIWREYHETTGVPELDRIFAVFCGGTIVSVARCRHHPDGMDVDGIFTPEAYRRQGYSRICVRALVEACHNDDLYMHAIRSLVGFYSEFGFKPINERDLPMTIRERYVWAAGNLEGADVQPMIRNAGL